MEKTSRLTEFIFNLTIHNMKKFLSSVLLMLLLYGVSMSDTISAVHFITILKNAPIEKKYSMVDSFIKAVESFPFIEQDSVVTFLARCKAKKVFITGDFNNWKVEQQMKKIAYTDLWYYTTSFEPEARLDYKFVIDGNTWILDPLNPATIPGGFGDNSELRMPEYLPAPEIEYHDTIPHGILIDTVLFSQYLKNMREVIIYLPAGYEEFSELPTIIFHDGTDYLNYAHADNILDYCISKGLIKPVIGVFLPPIKRYEEYAGKYKEMYGDFINRELFPYLYKHYSLSTDSRNHATIGASNGGNISLWLGLYYPDLLGKIGAQSSYVEPELQTNYKQAEKLPLSIFLDMGKYDIPALEMLVGDFRSILSEKGYDFVYNEYPEGHSWGNWRAHLKDIIVFFFGLR